MSLLTLERQLRRAGWYLKRVAGSHRCYSNQQGKLVVIAVHGGRVRGDIARKARGDLRRAGGALWTR